MKIRQQLFPAIFLFFTLTAGMGLSSFAQSSGPDKKAQQQALIKNMVDSQHYVFVAQSAMPMSGRTRQLTSEYDLNVSPTEVVSYLPYYGRAYTAPIDPSQGGIQFTSKSFDYTATPKKKGGWDVVIKPKDYRDVTSMSLSISVDGYASLQVTSSSRQGISFNGYIRAPRPKKS